MGRRPRFRQILPCLTVSLGVLLGSIGEVGSAWAWRDLGHKIVCQIAFQELNDTARAEVVRLIALGSTFDSFTDACTWTLANMPPLYDLSEDLFSQVSLPASRERGLSGR